MHKCAMHNLALQYFCVCYSTGVRVIAESVWVLLCLLVSTSHEVPTKFSCQINTRVLFDYVAVQFKPGCESPS